MLQKKDVEVNKLVHQIFTLMNPGKDFQSRLKYGL